MSLVGEMFLEETVNTVISFDSCSVGDRETTGTKIVVVVRGFVTVNVEVMKATHRTQ